MKKENIFVVIDDEEKRLRALSILSDTGDAHCDRTAIHDKFTCVIYLKFYKRENDWLASTIIPRDSTEITLDQLEQLLAPNYAVKEVHLTIDELKAQAESLGFDLVKKERKPKVGDFGMFKRDDSGFRYFGFLEDISNDQFYMQGNIHWDNFRHLTEEEKQNIQNNW